LQLFKIVVMDTLQLGLCDCYVYFGCLIMICYALRYLILLFS